MGKSVTRMKMHKMTVTKNMKLVYEVVDCNGNKILLTPCTLKKCRENDMKTK